MNDDTPSLVSTLISERIDKLAPQKNMRQLAREMGFRNSNMLSMIRRGDAKVPFAKLPIVADVLEIDPALLLRLHLRETWPDFEMVVFEIFGGILTVAEREWIEFFSDEGLVAPPSDMKMRKKLADFLKSLDWETE